MKENGCARRLAATAAAAASDTFMNVRRSRLRRRRNRSARSCSCRVSMIVNVGRRLMACSSSVRRLELARLSRLGDALLEGQGLAHGQRGVAERPLCLRGGALLLERRLVLIGEALIG